MNYQSNWIVSVLFDIKIFGSCLNFGNTKNVTFNTFGCKQLTAGNGNGDLPRLYTQPFKI